MLVEFECHGELCVLRLHGRFATGQDSAYLRGRTEDIKKSGAAKVLADFSQVDYIYTSVIKNPAGRFVLCNLNRRVREVLELTRLANVMAIYATEEAAMRALEEGQKLSAPQAG
jgi:anti-anti-sigma factor